ncbi:hypothetical protein C8R44DRAFT_736652 [Mycena epipterygia]|nr:hypothetical protein C8R44DRAFT_736652 [Mycena epipterygia]
MNFKSYPTRRDPVLGLGHTVFIALDKNLGEKKKVSDRVFQTEWQEMESKVARREARKVGGEQHSRQGVMHGCFMDRGGGNNAGGAEEKDKEEKRQAIFFKVRRCRICRPIAGVPYPKVMIKQSFNAGVALAYAAGFRLAQLARARESVKRD